MPRTVSLMPVYKEGGTIADVLKRTWPLVDMMVCVYDESGDGTLEALRKFARGRKGFYILVMPHNRGMAGALKAGFQFIQYLQSKGRVGPDDVVVMLDADGQHKPEYIPGALRHMEEGRYEMALMRRDFSNYPAYKIWGNRFLSAINSVLSGVRYHDVECGFRLMKVHVLPAILAYYTGVKYSCAQEIAFLSARGGFRVDNSFVIEIPFYRYRASFMDGFTVLGLILYTFFRRMFGITVPPEDVTELMERTDRDSRKMWR